MESKNSSAKRTLFSIFDREQLKKTFNKIGKVITYISSFLFIHKYFLIFEVIVYIIRISYAVSPSDIIVLSYCVNCSAFSFLDLLELDLPGI
jgi:hypothetical protein